MNEITIGDKVYISAKRAAEITGYARDYVGQLCREGHVDAKMVGRSWYVFEPSIRAHRFGTEVETTPEPVVSDEIENPETDSVGEEADEKPVVAAEEAAPTPIATASEWQTPKYTPEEPEMLPELTPASLEELLPPAEETLTDMQAAWREWFDQKQKTFETPEIESPEVIESRNEAYEAEEEVYEDENEPVEASEEPLEDDVETEEEEVIVPIHHIAPEPSQIHHAPIPAPRMEVIREIPSVMPDAAPVSRYSGEYAVPQAPHGRIIQERVIPKKANRKGKAKRARKSNAPIIAVLIGISLVAVTIALIGTGYAGRYLRTLPSENNPVINFLVGTQKFNI